MYRAGDTLGPYTFIRKIGRGNFGVVWLAEKRSAIATTQFALKLPLDDDVDVEAIKQEAALWSHASGHPNILPIIEADIHEEQIVIASEYAPDGSLADWLKANGGKAPTLKAAIEMTAGILAGLDRLHSKRIIHRDLKPRNILLQGETPRLADFGLARLLRASVQSNLVAGTPAYMAPEAFKGVRSEQTDLWAAAIIFYEMLAGRLPYLQQETETLVYAIMNEDPLPPPASLPEPLRELLNHALERDPEQRFKTAGEMREALSEAGLRVITGKLQAVAASSSDGGPVADSSDPTEEEMTRRVARVETELISERVKQLASEGAQAFASGHYANAVEKWEAALKLSPDEAAISASLESAKRKLTDLQHSLQPPMPPQADDAGNAPNTRTVAAGATGAQLQPDRQASEWPATQPLQSFGQSSAQYPADSGSRSQPQAPVKSRKWLRRVVFTLALLLIAGGAAAAVFYFKVFQSNTSLVVSKDDTGDYKTISEALRRAEPGARILVRAGTYNESLVLDKQVEIIGEAANNTSVIIESFDAPCVVMKTEQAAVRGLSLRGRAASKGGKQFAVDIPQGRLLIENCRITSDSLASIAVHGTMVNPTIRQSSISEGRNEGISFYDKAQGTIEDCDITGNGAAGVSIKDGANPTIRQSRIYNNKGSGLAVSLQGMGMVEGCQIYGHKQSNVSITSGGNPTVRRGRIYGGSSAVLVDERGQGTFDGVEIFQATEANVEITGASNPTFRNCRIRNSNSAGINIEGRSQGAIEACEIFDNASFGVRIENSSAAIRQSKIYSCEEAGIRVVKRSSVTIEGGEIYQIAGTGIEVSDSNLALSGGCNIRDCTTGDESGDGIAFADGATGSIEGCAITANQSNGVVINSGCRADIKQSQINGNKQAGVWIGESAGGIIEGCNLKGNLLGSYRFESDLLGPTLSRVKRIGNEEDIAIRPEDIQVPQ